MPIVHRDLKPMNLLLTAHLDVKVADLGISRGLAKLPQERDGFKMTGGVGTLRYMAPEVVRHNSYEEKVDIFAFALILYFMSSGREPFHHIRNPEHLMEEYIAGREPRPPVTDCPASLRPVLVGAWQAAPFQRPGAQELLAQLEQVEAKAPLGCLCVQM